MTTETLLVISSLVSVVVGLGLYIWYGFALSRLFPRLGGQGFKGWVPILNEMEILVRGGIPGWNIVFFFLPIVQIYGLYLKAMAVHRINEAFGKGAGFTVLGIFLPPVWATLLTGIRMPQPGEYDRRVEGLVMAAPRSGAVVGDLTPVIVSTAYAVAPPPPPAQPVPVSFPSLASSEPPFVAVPLASSPPPGPTAAPVLPSVPAIEQPEPAAVYAPWGQPPTPSPEAVLEPDPRPSVQLPPEDDDLDRTVAVDRRPLVPWRLVTDEGHVIPLRSGRVLLGRKPVSTTDDWDVVAVPDSTKTLSKNHARLVLDDEVWTVTDLDSTNGVIIIDADGTETLLPRNASAPVPGRFMLGKVAMRVSFDDMEATR